MTRVGWLVAGGLVLALGGPARATGEIFCEAVGDDAVWASVPVTRLPDNLVAPLSATVVAGERQFSTAAEEGTTAVVIVHTYGDANGTVIEMMDAGMEAVVVSLRLVRGSTPTDFVEAGVLVVKDAGVWAVTCLQG